MASRGMPKTTGRCFVPGDGVGAAFAYVQKPFGAVVAHAGQDRADGVGARASQHHVHAARGDQGLSRNDIVAVDSFELFVDLAARL